MAPSRTAGAGAATRRPVLLGVGTVGLFVFLFDAVLTWFGRGGTVPLALLAAGGALLLLVAALTSRTRSSHVARDRSGEAPGWAARRGPPPAIQAGGGVGSIERDSAS